MGGSTAVRSTRVQCCRCLTMTAAPSRPSRLAMPRPIPAVDAVTRQTLPAKRAPADAAIFPLLWCPPRVPTASFAGSSPPSLTHAHPQGIARISQPEPIVSNKFTEVEYLHHPIKDTGRDPTELSFFTVARGSRRCGVLRELAGVLRISVRFGVALRSSVRSLCRFHRAGRVFPIQHARECQEFKYNLLRERGLMRTRS